MDIAGATALAQDPTWSESVCRTRLSTHLDLLQGLATKLAEGGGFPTDAPKDLARVIANTATVLRNRLSEAPPEQLEDAALLVCGLCQDLRYVERSRVTQTPWSMIQAIQAFLAQHFGDDYSFIIRPQWSHNYGILGDFLQVYRGKIESLGWVTVQEWEKAIGSVVPTRIYCMSFPRVDRLNCLAHASLGHEVAHIVTDLWIRDHFDKYWDKEKATVTEAIRLTVVPKTPFDMFYELFQNEIVEVVASKVEQTFEVTMQGLRELMCDAVGLHMLGPAALSAVLEYSSYYMLDLSPLGRSNYPPWRYRLRRMVKACARDLEHDDEKACPNEKLQPYLQWLTSIRHLVQGKADLEVIDRDVVAKEAYRVIDKYYDEALREILKCFPKKKPLMYRLRDHLPDVTDLVRKLEREVPPNEVGAWPDGRAASLVDIFNAGWAFKIMKEGDRSGWGSSGDYEKLYRLLLKAIEASYVHASFGPEVKKHEHTDEEQDT